MWVPYWYGTGRHFSRSSIYIYLVFSHACTRAMIILWSHESRGADGNVVDLAGSAQLAQKEHSGPGGVSEKLAEGWGRPVQAHRATRTWLHPQGEWSVEGELEKKRVPSSCFGEEKGGREGWLFDVSDTDITSPCCGPDGHAARVKLSLRAPSYSRISAGFRDVLYRGARGGNVPHSWHEWVGEKHPPNTGPTRAEGEHWNTEAVPRRRGRFPQRYFLFKPTFYIVIKRVDSGS